MSCSVANSASPVFSHSKSMVAVSIFCNKSSPSSPSSSFRLGFQKPAVFVSSSTNVTTMSASPTVLKRKRPAKLDIPVQSFGFGVPVTPVVVEDVTEVEGDGYSVYCKRGRREAMEDRYSVVVNLQGSPKQALFGIFDGHGGPRAAMFAAENLEKNILDEVVKRDDDDDDDIKEAIKHGYLKTDSDFLKEDIRGGSCCVTALIRKGNLVVSNAGDCRAVMSRSGIAEELTSDHRPSRQDEKDRIENLGGYVDFCHGVWRIQGSLAVSRGIGDRSLKQWVISEPETKILKIQPEHEFLILASDGLWDKVTNQEAVDIARSLCIGVDKPEPLIACKRLVDLSVSQGSCDDTSVMLIQLGRYT